jgi:hypothetical protein
MNKYEVYHIAQCPNNGDFDYYKITIESHITIEVETINLYLSSISEVIFQECIADKLSTRFPATITVVGFHQGVKITSTRNSL